MAGGISINILSNVREAVRGTDNVADALDDVQDRLHDLTKEGDKSTDRMEQDFKDLARSADRNSDVLRDKFRQAYKDVARASGDAADSTKKGFAKGSEAAGEFKSEAAQNLSEVVSSFDGSMDSIGDLVQGTFGGLAGSLPGALGVAGAGAAAAVGLIVSAFQKAGEAADEAKESAYEYGITVAESGEFADASARLHEYTGSVEGLQKVMDIATISGWKQKDVLTALATGDGLPALADAFNEGANSTAIASSRALELQGVLDGTKQGLSLAGDAASLTASSLYDLAVKAGTAKGEVDDLGNSVVTMPDGKEVVINARTREAYEDVDAFEKKRIPDKSATVKFKPDTSALDGALDKYRGKVITVKTTTDGILRRGRQLLQ